MVTGPLTPCESAAVGGSTKTLSRKGSLPARWSEPFPLMQVGGCSFRFRIDACRVTLYRPGDGTSHSRARVRAGQGRRLRVHRRHSPALEGGEIFSGRRAPRRGNGAPPAARFMQGGEGRRKGLIRPLPSIWLPCEGASWHSPIRSLS